MDGIYGTYKNIDIDVFVNINCFDTGRSSRVGYSRVQYSTVQYSTVQYSTAQ